MAIPAPVPGLYVSSFLRAEDAARLAVNGGEEPDTLHVTLAYLGDLADLGADGFETCARVCSELALRQPPLDGASAGFGVFRSGGEQDPFWATVDVVGLAELRHELCEALSSAGLASVSEHGFEPHITVAYLPGGSPVMVGPSEPVPLRLETVTAAVQGTDLRRDFPLAGPTSEHVPELAVAVMKAHDEQQVVYGIVLQPDVPDSQGDVVDPAEIEKAAHRFLYQRTPIGIQHAALAPESVRPVESYLAPVDFEVETPRGRETVRKGSWVVAAHVPDAELWTLVKSDGFTGWSIAGTGRRTPL